MMLSLIHLHSDSAMLYLFQEAYSVVFSALGTETHDFLKCSFYLFEEQIKQRAGCLLLHTLTTANIELEWDSGDRNSIHLSQMGSKNFISWDIVTVSLDLRWYKGLHSESQESNSGTPVWV